MTPETIYVLTTLMLFVSGSAFILDGQKCIAYQPCTCSGSSVYCSGKSLTAVPKFEVSNLTGSYVYLYLYSNQLTSVPANVFSNLTASNSTNVILELNNNKLNSISTNAFVGIADRITQLYLNGNNLTQVPAALKILSNLNYLNLQSNPITSLSSSYDTFHNLRSNLKTLDIDLKGFSAWPNELNLLTSLDNLYIHYLNLTHLEYNTFHGYEDSLHSLTIQYSQLERIPVAVCHLRNLQTLTFSYNKNIHTNSTFYEPCKPKLTSLTNLDLSSNNLRYMPDILRSFPSLTQLTINNNQLSYIHWDLVPSNSPLKYLYMNGNDFTRIPTVVSKFHNLDSLYLSNNKITSIEDSDLHNLVRLRYLYLQGNPIEYISPHAFKSSPDLYQIELRQTNLRQLPNSLASLKNLHNIYLYNAPIECNCDLSFMKALNVSQINIYGNCHSSSVTLKTYLTDDLPYCP